MVMSNALKKILTSKINNPYSENKTIEELRDEHRTSGSLVPLPEGTEFKTVNAYNVAAEWITLGKVSSQMVFLFIHGGGYYRGSIQASRATVARISAAANIQCLSIDYRLAPENTYPAAVDDTYVAYKWLIDQGYAPEKIIVGGMSAGGGLTLALLLKLKEMNEFLPAGAVLMSAWTDLTQSGQTMKDNAEVDPVISKAYLDRMAGLYLAGTSAKTKFASPLFGDLEGLPPMLVQVGSAETMLDDSRRFAKKAKKANVDVDYEPWDDMFHGWQGSAHVLDEAKLAIDSIGRFCRRVLEL